MRYFFDKNFNFFLRFIIIILICLNFSDSNNDRETYEINIYNHKFEPSIIYVKENAKIRLVIINNDSEVEEFETIDLKREKIVPPNGRINLLIGPLKKGEYEFFGDFHPSTARGKIIVE